MAATKKSQTKKSATKTSATKRSATKQSPPKRSATKRSPAKKSAAKKSAATRSAAKQSAATRSAVKKSPTKKVATKRSAATRSPTKNTKKTATKSATKRSATKQSAQKRAPARRDAIAVLKADHRHVEDLFDEFEALGDRAHKTRAAIVSTIIEELSVHAGIEEIVFYPAVRERLAAADESMVLEALEEHHLVKLTLNELEKMSPEDERYVAKVTVLREVVDHHVEEEESDLFKRVRSEFSTAELTDLGDELTAARAAAPTRPHPAAPDTPPGNIVANVLVAPLDAATSLAERAADAVRGAIS